MPTLPEILNRLQFISQEAALLGLFLTASIILVGRDWRILILALLAQYILVGLILSRLVRPDIAALKVMIGAFICPILFLSARQVSVSSAFILPFSERNEANVCKKHVNWRRYWSSSLIGLLKGKDRYRSPSPTGFVFRLLVVLLLILVATSLSRTFALPGLSASVAAAVYWLVLAGLVTLVLTEDPMKVGLGLLTGLTGFDLVYATLERSLLLTGLWGAVSLLLALAMGYLIVAKGAGSEEEL